MAVIKRFWRRTAASSSTVCNSPGACGDWVTIGADLTSTSFGTDKTPGPLAMSLQPSARSKRQRHAVGRAKARTCVCRIQCRRRDGGERDLLPHRQRVYADALRERHRSRSGEPEPRLHLVLRLQRVCKPSRTATGHVFEVTYDATASHGDLDEYRRLQPRRRAGHRRRLRSAIQAISSSRPTSASL